MTVAELIAILSKADPDMKVTVWDGFHDQMSIEVHVSKAAYQHRESAYDTIHLNTLVFSQDEELT